jgi:ATP-dependent RNA helicase CshB
MGNHPFERFEFKPFIQKAVEELGFHQPTEIQEKMIPVVKRGESAIGQSQTGTGKTHAYLLPAINKIKADQIGVQVVITAPTRELANQIYAAVQGIIRFSEKPLTAKCFIGGTDKSRSIEGLKIQPHIVVGTPGRINDLVNANALEIHQTRIMIIDEADLMLEMGFLEDVDQIAGRMPEKLQLLIFSATIPEKLKPFLKKYLKNPTNVHVQPKQLTAFKIEHVLIPLKSREKLSLLTNVLKTYNPYLSIVFANTKAKVDEIANHLNEQGLRTAKIHGDITPRERKRVMKQIHQLEYQFIVATDLASRGIDISGISHVVNFELPKDLDFYIHRTGRTARADFSGTAATIYTPSDEDALNQLEKMGIDFAHHDIQKNELVELPKRNKRKNRVKGPEEVESKSKAHIRKPSKVKPGYKKKMQRQVDEIKKKERRVKRDK